MTTSEDKRFAAAVAAMTGLIPVLERGNHDYYLGVRSPQEVASEAIEFADALIAKLEETAPQEKVCEHRHTKSIPHGMSGFVAVCTDCQQVLP